MNVLWIIGNGFDLNLGLKTSYKSFCEDVYFKQDRYKVDREKLMELNCEDCKDFTDDLLWSDLELLLGKATALFSKKDIEGFHEIFERMEGALCDYLAEQQSNCSGYYLQDVVIDEFWKSISRFENRLPVLDKEQFGSILRPSENTHFDFISLNYTSCFDEMLKKAAEARHPFDQHGTAVSHISEALHIHGELGNNGSVVFGVSDSSQIANAELAEDEDFTELWVKRKKNVFYRNDKTSRLEKCIARAQYICIFGASMGETDSYIWELLGGRIARSSEVRIVLFSHSIEPPGGIQGRRAQRARNEEFARVARAFCWDETTASVYKDRVLILPSNTVFSFPSAQGSGNNRKDGGSF